MKLRRRKLAQLITGIVLGALFASVVGDAVLTEQGSTWDDVVADLFGANPGDDQTDSQQKFVSDYGRPSSLSGVPEKLELVIESDPEPINVVGDNGASGGVRNGAVGVSGNGRTAGGNSSGGPNVGNLVASGGGAPSGQIGNTGDKEGEQDEEESVEEGADKDDLTSLNLGFNQPSILLPGLGDPGGGDPADLSNDNDKQLVDLIADLKNGNDFPSLPELVDEILPTELNDETNMPSILLPDLTTLNDDKNGQGAGMDDQLAGLGGGSNAGSSGGPFFSPTSPVTFYENEEEEIIFEETNSEDSGLEELLDEELVEETGLPNSRPGNSPAEVPEPSGLALLGLALIALGLSNKTRSC